LKTFENKDIFIIKVETLQGLLLGSISLFHYPTLTTPRDGMRNFIIID